MPELQEMIGQMKDKIANRLKPKRKSLQTTGRVWVLKHKLLGMNILNTLVHVGCVPLFISVHVS